MKQGDTSWDREMVLRVVGIAPSTTVTDMSTILHELRQITMDISYCRMGDKIPQRCWYMEILTR